LKSSYTVSETLCTLIREKLDPQTIHNWNFRRPHTCHAEDDFAVLLNDKSLQLEFPKQIISFLDKNKKWMLSHFWSSHS